MRNMEKQTPESIILTFGVPLTKFPIGNISLLLGLLLVSSWSPTWKYKRRLPQGSLLDYSGIDIDFDLKVMVLLLTVVVPPSGT